MSSKPGTPRTRWSHPEIKIVTDASVEFLLQKYKTLDMFPSADAVQKADIRTALVQGQLALPEGRRKKEVGDYITEVLIPQVREGLRSRIQHIKSIAGQPELKPVPPVVAKNDESIQVAPKAEELVVEPPPVDPLAALAGALGAQIAKGFIAEVERSPIMVDLLKLLKPKTPAVADAGVRSGPRLAATNVTMERNRRPKVAIIGLHDDQRQAIMRQFPNIDMRFLDNRPTGDRLATVTQSCDSAVLMTKFCSHLPMKLIRAKHYVPVNGGMTELGNVLRGRYGEPTSARHPAAA